MYHYTIQLKEETFQSEDALYQKNEAEFLRNRGYVQWYLKMKNF